MPADSTLIFDLVVLGGTPGGICAAVAAARAGRKVLLIERTRHLGGLPANGLGITDIVTRSATGGLFGEFIGLIRRHYIDTYGEDSEQVNDCDGGYRFEPRVAERVLEQMVAEQPNLSVLRRRQFDANAANAILDGKWLSGIVVVRLDSGERETHRGRVFVDATYEGDLAAAAGVPYRVGREGRDEHGEPCAGRVYWSWDTGELLEGSTGEADRAVQAYNYRICLTNRPELLVPIEKPSDYRRDDYISLLDDVETGQLQHAVARWPKPACFKPVPIPNGKFDANDHPKSLISTDLPEENWPYPEADWTWRDRFAQRLRDYELGLLWFCQHDKELPELFRRDAQRWGLCLDEYEDNGNFPRQLYVREGRRIMGEHLFTALDCIAPSDLPRAFDILAGRAEPNPTDHAPRQHNAIALAHYPIDSHACRKREPGRAVLDGYFALNKLTLPYQVPYGVIVPLNVEGLLVPVACSATHLGFGTLRMEPCWMALGHAAGIAAHLSITDSVPPRKVNIHKLQQALEQQGAVLHSDIHP